jgi:hypothetical protein
MEGDNCTGLSGCTCPSPDITSPLYDYANAGSECAVTGGYMYRGCSAPELEGQYIFGDYCSARIWALTHDGVNVTDTVEITSDVNPTSAVGLLSSFGEDANGDLYMLDLDGDIYKIISDQSACGDCDCPYQGDLDQSLAYDASDLNELIDVLFFNAPDPQDPMCPITRSDLDASTAADAVDLNYMVDLLFFNGPTPVDPCAP